MSSWSSTSSARRQTEAERSALVIRAAALKEIHALEGQERVLQKEREALEEQERVLQKKRQMLELNTQLAATEAKIAEKVNMVVHIPNQMEWTHTLRKEQI